MDRIKVQTRRLPLLLTREVILTRSENAIFPSSGFASLELGASGTGEGREFNGKSVWCNNVSK